MSMQPYVMKATVKTINLRYRGDYTIETETLSRVDDIEFKDTHVVFYLLGRRIKAFRADHVLEVETYLVKEDEKRS